MGKAKNENRKGELSSASPAKSAQRRARKTEIVVKRLERGIRKLSKAVDKLHCAAVKSAQYMTDAKRIMMELEAQLPHEEAEQYEGKTDGPKGAEVADDDVS